MKNLFAALIATVLLSGCSSYFTDYQTVYRIETTNGERYYSEDEPDLDKAKGIYELEDLDGNTYNIKQELIYKVEKFKHKK